MSYKKDLNSPNIDVERWNRMDHILRFISYAQSTTSYGDMTQNLDMMYQGLQIMLDTITPDFTENKTNEEGKKVVLKGFATKQFNEYRTKLDTAQALSNQSKNPKNTPQSRARLRDASYKKLQELKYALLQECEKLGYNARKSDTNDAYRQGNN